MAEVGYRPADVTYLAMSHGHGDHTANANDFQGSTWLVNKAEYDAMFAGEGAAVLHARHLLAR